MSVYPARSRPRHHTENQMAAYVSRHTLILNRIHEMRIFIRIMALVGLLFSHVLYAEITWEKEMIKMVGAPFDDHVSFSFPFVNSGNSTVVIGQVKASCGCTVPSLAQKEYKAGEEGQLTGTFSLRGRRGLNNVAITVNSETQEGDVKRPLVYNLKLQVFIPDALVVQPSISLWKKKSALSEKIIRVEVKQSSPLTLKLSGVSNEFFTLTMTEEFPGRIYKIVATPKNTNETQQAVATIEATDEDGKTAKFFAHLAVK